LSRGYLAPQDLPTLWRRVRVRRLVLLV